MVIIMYKRRKTSFAALILFILLAALISFMCIFCYMEYKLRPIISEAAVSRARVFASELINNAVIDSMSECPPLVNVSAGEDGITGVQTDIAALAKLRSSAVTAIMNELECTDSVSFSVPLGNLVGSTLIAGRGIPIKIKLVPIGDIDANVRTEFIESGINQTLHKIIMRVRITVNVLVSDKSVKLELANDISLAETVIVGKVPDAYTAINRFEIDEDEENDLNDYSATLP